MPTREQVSRKIRRDLADHGLTPADPTFGFALAAMEDMNEGMADIDDELADLAVRLAWLAHAPTWLNQRALEEFDAFVNAKLVECETALAAVRRRWEQHQTERNPTDGSPREA